jgi:hypothetical protein
MNFKANRDGTYDTTFKAADLPSIVRMVQQNEIWRREDADEAIKNLQHLVDKIAGDKSAN